MEEAFETRRGQGQMKKSCRVFSCLLRNMRGKRSYKGEDEEEEGGRRDVTGGQKYGLPVLDERIAMLPFEDMHEVGAMILRSLHILFPQFCPPS